MPVVCVEGEVKNYRLSNSKWVYFDIADDEAKVRCFGMAFRMPGPLADGMIVRLTATPRLHNQFGMSLNIMSVEFGGEGSIKKAKDLLRAKLEAEGLFDTVRKRSLPYPPRRIALITSRESAGYRDFIKVLGNRFGGIDIELHQTQVQGDVAVGQIIDALDSINGSGSGVEVIVMVRGGGSADDLQAFSDERLVRAVAGSRVPTLVAIGHETDVSLAELVADKRASTPSNSAELLVPSRDDLNEVLNRSLSLLDSLTSTTLISYSDDVDDYTSTLRQVANMVLGDAMRNVDDNRRLLESYSPRGVLSRGYAMVRGASGIVSSAKQVAVGDSLTVEFFDDKIKVIREE